MRYLTILLAVFFGMMLSWIMLLNPQYVQLQLDTSSASWVDPPLRQMPLWKVIFWSVFIGMLIGFLLTWSGGADTRRRLRDLEEDRSPKPATRAADEDPDYVAGLRRR